MQTFPTGSYTISIRGALPQILVHNISLTPGDQLFIQPSGGDAVPMAKIVRAEDMPKELEQVAKAEQQKPQKAAVAK